MARLSAGSPLTLRHEQAGNPVLCDAHGTLVGRLSGKFKPPNGMKCIDARVAAIHVRRVKDVGEEHRARIDDRCDSWETVIPELVFAPEEQVRFSAPSPTPESANASPLA